MKNMLLAITALALLGCNTPSRDFRGIEAVQITVAGSTFDIRVRGNRAEAIRINSEYAPRLSGIAPKAFVAIERVSGCKVRRLGGDQALIHASLKCGNTPDAMVPLPVDIRYECEIDDIYTNRGLGEMVTEMNCAPVRL
ncbi:MAG: hypothetical protein Q9M48_06840 [Rhodobacterales bacterium]|nr:hypothetical protein [Rhodobacterales bacterium]